MQKPRALLTFIIAALALASPLFPLFTTPVSAATTLTASRTFSNMKVDEQATSWWYYTSLRRCVGLNVDGWNWAENDVKSGNWFNGTFASQPERIQYGYYMNGQLEGISTSRQQSGMGTTLNASTTCDKELGELVKKAVAFWGISDSSPGVDPILGLFCEIGARERRDGTDCKNGTGDFRSIPQSSSGRATNFTNVIRQVVYGGVDPSQFARPLAYYYHLRTFMNACAPGKTFLTTQPNGNNVYSVGIPNSQSNQVELRYVVGTESGAARVDTFPDGTERTCEELAKSTLPDGVYATAYNAAVAANNNLAIEQGTIDQIAGGTGSPSCLVEGIGWIVCPVAIFIGKASDGMYGLVEQLLVFTIDNPFETGPSNPLYTAWSNIRNLANVAFIIAFFMIILSQATNIGISSYGIKKMLPRLIVAAILVNLSYYICLLGIDISNIIGSGIDGVLNSAKAGVGSGEGTELGLTTWITAALAGGGGAAAYFAASSAIAAGGTVASILGGLGLTFGLAALTAILTALVILIGRQALLIMLVIIAPLAFVAYILPNTEGLFSKWRKLFITMLVFYPLVALLFSGAELAAILMRSASNNALIDIFSIGVQAFPLFATPVLLKLSGGLLGRIAGIVNNPNKGPIDALRKAGQRELDASRNKTLGRRRSGGRRNMFGKQTPLTRLGDRITRRQDAKLRKHAGWEYEAKRADAKRTAERLSDDEEYAASVANATAYGKKGSAEYALATARARARGVAEIDKLKTEESSAARTVISDLQLTQAQRIELASTGKATGASGTIIEGEFYQKAAQSMFIEQGRIDKIEEILKHSGSMSPSVREFLYDRLDASFAGLKPKGHHLNNERIKDLLKRPGTYTEAEMEVALNTSAKDIIGLSPELVASHNPDGLRRLKTLLNTGALSPTDATRARDLMTRTLASDSRKNLSADSLALVEAIAGQAPSAGAGATSSTPQTVLVSPSGAPLSSANTTPTATSAAPTILTNPSATPTASTSTTTNPATPPAPTTLADRLAPPLSPTTGTLPPSGVLPPTPTPPASTISETQQARQAGGNFGGFNTPPAPQPTTPASEAEGYQDETGASIPGTVENSEEYLRRMNGERP